MTLGVPALLTTEELAHELGYKGRASIHARIDRGDLRLASCRIPGTSRRCWSRARLQAGGFLAAPQIPTQPDAIPSPGSAIIATWRIA